MSLRVGQLVSVKGNEGVIRFIGQTKFAPGNWIGVELNEPVGRNNGSVDGIVYFKCRQDENALKKYGVFVPPALIIPASSDIEQRARYVVDKLQVKLQNALSEIKQHKKDIELLKIQLASSQAQLEQTVVDRDFLKDENDRLNTSLAQLQKQYDDISIELSQAYEELELNKEIELEIRDQVKSVAVDGLDKNELLVRHRKLEMALVNFQNIAAQKEISLNDEILLLKAKQNKDGIAAEDYRTISAKLEIAEQTITSLKAQLESTNDLESIIERLTTDNDSLSAEIARLKKNIDELNEVIDLDRELEASQSQLERDLKLNIEQLNQTLDNERKSKKQLELQLKNLDKSKPAKSDPSDSSQRLSRLIEDSEIKLKLAQREREFLQLLLDISKAKIDVYETQRDSYNRDSISLRAFQAALKQIADTILRARSADRDFEQGFQVELSIYSIEYLTSIIDVLIKYFNSSIDTNHDLYHLFTPILEELLLHFENRTLHTFETTRIRKVVKNLEDLVKTLDNETTSNVTLNEFLLHRILYEMTIGKLKLDRIKGVVSCDGEHRDTHHIQNLSVLLETSTKLRKICDSVIRFHNKVEEVDQLIDLPETDKTLSLFESLDPFFYDLSLNNGDQLDHDSLARVTESLLLHLNSIQNSLEVDFKALRPTKRTHTAELNDMKALQFELKDQTIKDLELNVNLLTNNISTLTSHHKESLAKIQNELNQVKQKYQSIEDDKNTLLVRNKKLEEELQATLSSGKYFETSYIKGQFSTLESEKEFVSSIALMEELAFLRSLIKKEPVHEDLSFIQGPLVSVSPDDFHLFNLLGKNIRAIAEATELMDLRKPTNFKYYKASLEERVCKYESMRDRVLSL